MTDTIVVQPTAQTIEVIAEPVEVVVSASGPQGIPGPQGPPGESAGAYVYNQIAPSTTWTITHNLNYHPNATTLDTGGTNIFGVFSYPNTNTLVIDFTTAVSGVAYLS